MYFYLASGVSRQDMPMAYSDYLLFFLFARYITPNTG